MVVDYSKTYRLATTIGPLALTAVRKEKIFMLKNILVSSGRVVLTSTEQDGMAAVLALQGEAIIARGYVSESTREAVLEGDIAEARRLIGSQFTVL